MLIIVEGPDGAGKTTFVEQLRERHPKATVMHFGPPTTWAVSEIELRLQDYIPGESDVICDRCHIGELIYGPIYRGASQLNDAGLTHVTAFLRAKGAVIAYLDQPDQVLINRVKSRGDDYIDIDHLPAIAAAYRARAKVEPLTSRTNPTVTAIERIARAAEEDAMFVGGTLNSYVGDHDPLVLFIGESKSSMAGAHKQAFVPWPKKSGEYLMNAAAQLPWSWGVLNWADDDVISFLSVLDESAYVIALGQNVSKTLDENNIEHATIAHPSWATRFGFPLETYVEQIKEIVK